MLSPASALSTTHSPVLLISGSERYPRVVGKTDVKSQIREAQRTWLRDVARRMGESVSELAVNAGVADVTLTRFLNREDYRGVLSSLTIEQIKRYSGLPGPTEPGSGKSALSFSEGAQYNYKAEKKRRPTLSAMIEAALDGRPDASPWLLETTALEALHYLKGDVLICDASADKRAGDLVIAQVYDRRGSAETVFRIFEPPYLIGFASDPSTRKPLLIDNGSVRVVGPVTEGIRAR